MASFVFEGMAEAFIFSISAAEIFANRFSAILFGKTIVTAQSSLSSNYCLRVTAEGANQNAVRPFFNTEFILMMNSNCNKQLSKSSCLQRKDFTYTHTRL